MKLPTLYSRTSTGATQQWTVEIEGDKYRTMHGQVGGKTVTTSWFKAMPTNEGRANHRDGDAQAIFEAQACWKKKIESGSFEDINAIDTPKFVEPMLAKKWEDRKDKVKFPVYTQPKFDGMRAVISKTGPFSRSGKPWMTIPHILEELEIVFKEIPGLILDGELYNHDFHDDFNKISSLIKKTKPTSADLTESEKYVQYHCYDICDDSMIFSERSVRLNQIIKQYNLKYVIPVLTFKTNTEAELDELYGKFLEENYEGQMIRLDTPYEFKRSANLLKRKTFVDDEYKIIEIGEGNGNRSLMAGFAIMEREDGVRFRSNIKGSHDFLTDLWNNRDQYAGTWATCKFFNLTPDGIPRFPYLIKLRAGKGQD